jgi:hypothetical protein
MATNKKHIRWFDIKNFHNQRVELEKYPVPRIDDPITYRAKVKLHGTNGGVAVHPDGEVVAMSRAKVITPTDDNAGFAAWVEERKDQITKCGSPDHTVVICGEWCGPGINRGVGICKIPNKIFAVFALRLIDDEDGRDTIIVDPVGLHARCGHIDGVYVIPWYDDGKTYDISWKATTEELQPILDVVNADVNAIEARDPFVANTFDVDGIGEGLVFYPKVDDESATFATLTWKAKGKEHQTVNARPAEADPIASKDAEAFAQLVVTPARLEQGAREVAGGELKFDVKNMGPFLGWIAKDVAKETPAELASSKLNAKVAAKACTMLARNWYLDMLKRA